MRRAPCSLRSCGIRALIRFCLAISFERAGHRSPIRIELFLAFESKRLDSKHVEIDWFRNAASRGMEEIASVRKRKQQRRWGWGVRIKFRVVFRHLNTAPSCTNVRRDIDCDEPKLSASFVPNLLSALGHYHHGVIPMTMSTLLFLLICHQVQ